jgi:hypothetical protein
MKIGKYRDNWMRYHGNYEKRAYKLLMKTFRKWIKRIDFDAMTEGNYKTIIQNSSNVMEMFDTYTLWKSNLYDAPKFTLKTDGVSFVLKVTAVSN